MTESFYDLPATTDVMDAWRTDPQTLSGSRLLRALAEVESTTGYTIQRAGDDVTALRIGLDDATIMRPADRELRHHALTAEVDRRLAPKVMVNIHDRPLTLTDLRCELRAAERRRPR